ncbi:MAG: hypothetical protein FWD31_13445 [Planctomycetaceae bacterium]|nr:hypothetical protein [Planctomycetaceae bacterium]
MQLPKINDAGVQFGTSGLRGLVSDMSDVVCYAYSKAFLHHYLSGLEKPSGKKTPVAISGDLRESTGRIIRAVSRAVFDMGMIPLDCGRIPTPTLAHYAFSRRIAGIMVTGSHIPDDRNGIKFFLPSGEMTKLDEQSICLQEVDISDSLFSDDGHLRETSSPYKLSYDHREATRLYSNRYTSAFPESILAGMRLGLFEHSAVGRELLGNLFESLGAEVVRLGRTNGFLSIDTESLSPDVMQKTASWAAHYGVDAILSTDGDGDRPLVFDENGNWICGDIIAALTAWFLRAETAVTSVTTTGSLERSGLIPTVVRTKVGSPYVIETMQQRIAAGHERVVGFEPNGGFMIGTPFELSWLASDLHLPIPKTAIIEPLLTRDSVIVHLAILSLAKHRDLPLSKLVALFPTCHKLSDRVPEYPNEISSQMLHQLAWCDGERRPGIDVHFGELLPTTGPPILVDMFDGFRMTFEHGEIIHLRASGNAPEFRCYVEASSLERSRALLVFALETMRAFREKSRR